MCKNKANSWNETRKIEYKIMMRQAGQLHGPPLYIKPWMSINVLFQYHKNTAACRPRSYFKKFDIQLSGQAIKTITVCCYKCISKHQFCFSEKTAWCNVK